MLFPYFINRIPALTCLNLCNGILQLLPCKHVRILLPRLLLPGRKTEPFIALVVNDYALAYFSVSVVFNFTYREFGVS